MSSSRRHAPSHAPSQVTGIDAHPSASVRGTGSAAHLHGMSNNTISKPITNWQELWASDREVLNRAEVARLLGVDARTVSAAVGSGDLPGLHLGRRLLIPRRPLLEKLGIAAPAA